MVDLLISQKEIETLLPSVNEELRINVFAHAAWSVICEPGDGFAGLMVSVLGAARALELEINKTSVSQIKEEIQRTANDPFVIEKFGVFEKAHHLARARWASRIALEPVRVALYQITKIGGQLVSPIEENWPKQLFDLGNHSPMALWVLGDPKNLHKLEDSLSIVGCRGASSYGEEATSQLVEALVAKGFSIVSGGAYGIDAAAHRSALAARGNTVAIMAGGVDRFYPTGNSDLLKRISQTGNVLSEMPPGNAPSKWRFLQRNRLISALSQATIVVEANWRSGSINTVSHSEELGRDIFAVPGPITSPQSAGTNRLIADHRAQSIVDAEDLLQRLGASAASISADQLEGLSSIETRVFDALGFDTKDLQEICREAGLSRDEANFGLANLEIDGLVVRRGTAWVKSQTTV